MVSLLLVLELVPREGPATGAGAGLEGAALAFWFSSWVLVEEEVCDEEAALEEVEERVEARLGVGFREGGAMDGVEGWDTGFMSHLDRFAAGVFSS